MRRQLHHRKRVVRWLLGAVLFADLVLAGVSWRLARSPQVPAGELVRLDVLEKSYRADNTRLDGFRKALPADEKQWDDFFETHFRPAAEGYSAISADLGELSASAGLAADRITFRQRPPDARGLMEVDIVTAVEGNYESLVNFLDQLGHSENFYVLDSLSLASSTPGRIRLNLQLRTYFRT